MTLENDLLLSKITIRLKDPISFSTIGSGFIYSEISLKDKVYIITAAHNLYKDLDSFKHPINDVIVDIYNEKTNLYESIKHIINYDFVLPNVDNDLAVLIINKNIVENISGKIPIINVIKEKLSFNNFILKGFPNATRGEELVTINPIWLQKMTGVQKFQLQLQEDYTSWAISGFSGSGIFLNADNNLYLFGFFTRFRSEGKGKVIYGQFIETINEILSKNFLPLIKYSYLGEHGLTNLFFHNHINIAIDNLGERYNKKINFKLPVAKLFNDIAKDDIFKERFIKTLDKWILSRNYGYDKDDSSPIFKIEQEFTEVREDVKLWLSTSLLTANNKIEIKGFITKIVSLNNTLEAKRNELQRLQWEMEKKSEEVKKDHKYQPPFESEIHRLYEISSSNNSLLEGLERLNIELVNNPCLIIQGEGGSGKSHLLGDIADERNKRDKPTILLLGQLFKGTQSVWQNVLAQLGIACTKDELLKSLNNIGEQIGSRILILIDALNEGAGKELWPHEIIGFINEFRTYPFIGLVFTIRSTYYNDIIPTTFQKTDYITQITHEGFKGNEYSALKFFCEYYELEQPNFPILSPEFSNPLFLQLTCESLNNSGQKKFPQGFQGINTIFQYYIKTLSGKLSRKRDEYRLKPKLAVTVIHEVAIACFENEDSRVLPLDQAIELFEKKFPKYQYLLDDFILENIFIKSSIYDYKTDTSYEAIYFSYERFGDFYIAQELLKPYKTDTIIEAFAYKNKLGKLLIDGFNRNRGIIEAMAVLLPENYNVELFEVFGWAFRRKNKNLLSNIDDWINSYVLDSLKWRTTQSVDNSKLTKWFNSNTFNLDQFTYFNGIIELTTHENHPFNSDRLYSILNQHSMPIRDSYWQQYLRFYSKHDDNKNAYPIRRLIDWAWQPNISNKLSSETARLTAQTLAWVLASTDNTLRDQTTKAIVNLLEEQPDALISILKKFNNNDDVYILERLFGIAYGCALRTSSNANLLSIAQYVFNAVFKNGNPPAHVLLRDYARNTVEYALYNKLDINADVSLINPPYKSKMPLNIPTKEQMKNYELDYEKPNFRQSYGPYFNQIKHSVMDWDFGRYTVDSAFSDFNGVSFTIEKEYKAFIIGLTRKQKQIIKPIESHYKTLFQLDNKKNYLIKNFGEKEFNALKSTFEKEIERVTENLKEEFKKDEYDFFIKIGKPYIKSKTQPKESLFGSFDTEPIKRWIVQRVFEYGYQAKLHGPYEASLSGFNNTSGYRIERIGKKYQWIALYEIVAIVADNYKIKEERWSTTTKYKFYQGPWQGYLRDIDPAFITKNRKVEPDIEESEDESQNLNWWSAGKYEYWNVPLSEWAKTNQDLPDPKDFIQRVDDTGIEWLYLNTNIRWKEPKPFGEEEYNRTRKEIWYLLQGYLIPKKNKRKILNWLNKQSFWGRWMPDSHRASSGLFNRENYWSLASKENEPELWQKLKSTDHKVMVTTSEAVGELSKDKSGAHFSYEMPCKLLFEGMNLKYAGKDGEFINEHNEVVVTSVENGILIKKKLLHEYLEKNKLDIIWTLLGEKFSMSSLKNNRETNYFKVVNGVYFLKEQKLNGKLSLIDRD